MKKPLPLSELSALAASHPALEAFGPESPDPYLALTLNGQGSAPPTLSTWLQSLPCPVIGIGQGPLAPACDVVIESEKPLAKLDQNIRKTPFAAMVLVQHLRASENLPHEAALTAESLAYGTLQQGPEFRHWRDNNITPAFSQSEAPPLAIDVSDNELSLTLDRPDTRNAIDVVMRDALCEALDLALVNPAITRVHLTGAGRAFSTGGAVEEFGDVSDPVTAHWVRSVRLPAARLAKLRGKLHVHVNGAAIGAGAEIAAFARHVTASPKSWFQLPELKYGLLPGAGGTVSIPRRIGRQRAAYMALSMDKIRAKQALAWGLIDAIED